MKLIERKDYLEKMCTHVNDRIFKILQLAGVTKVIGIDRERFWNQSE